MSNLKEYYKSILAYIFISFVLVMGSGLIKIHADSFWFYLVKFGIISTVLVLGLYFYFKQNISSYLKLSLFVPFTIDFHLQYAFIILTIILFNKKLLVKWKGPLKPIYLLFIWSFISYIINQFIEFNPVSFPLFIGTFFVPFTSFGLFYNFANDEIKEDLKTFFKNIVFIMCAIVFAQAYFLCYEHPDHFSGGTQNAHIAASFMTIAIMMALYRKVFKVAGNDFSDLQDSLLLLTVPILLFFMDAKLFIVMVIFLILILIFTRIVKTYKNRIIGLILILLVIGYWYNFTERKLPLSLLAAEINSYTLDNVTANYFEKPKGRLIREIVNIPTEDPLRFLIGSGPGTFNSRAALLKHKIADNKDHVGLGGNREGLAIHNYNFLEPTETRVQKKYADILNDKANFMGSLYERKSTLLAIVYELGLVGICLFIYFFYMLFNRSFSLNGYNKMILFSLITTTIIICYFSFWMELLNFSTINYAFIGLLINGKLRNE